ncbi:hypothetical protein EMIT048CA2_50131 [Pseudomonas chlororaphis]
MGKLYANYGRKNKPCETPVFLSLQLFAGTRRLGLFDRVVQLFSTVIRQVQYRKYALFYGGCVTD